MLRTLERALVRSVELVALARVIFTVIKVVFLLVAALLLVLVTIHAFG